MSAARREPEYVVARVRRVLEGEAELGIDVRVLRDAIYLAGVVATEPRRARLGTLVAELFPDRHVVNGIRVAVIGEPAAPESLE